MPKLKRLSGSEVLDILKSFGFEVSSQRGSHVKLRRYDREGRKQTITIPKHKRLDTGTCRSIFRQASEYIDESLLRRHFYSE